MHKVSVHDLRVSCIVPTHNREDFLAEALDSIASQTFKPAEVIVVDDLGSRTTRLTVERFSKLLNVVYVDSSGQDRHSAGASRNVGASHASGTHLAFLDDDDIWTPDFLQRCVQVIIREGADLAVSWASFCQGQTSRPGHTMPQGLKAADTYAHNPGLTGSNFLISHDIFRKLDGFDSDLWVSNDRDFLIRFLKADYRYGVVTARTVSQRVHADGQLTNRTERRAAGLEAFRRKHLHDMSPRDLRHLRREICSVRRVSAQTRTQRALFLVLQILTYTPWEAAKVLRKIADRDRHIYR